jgi:hypothetical protein
VEKEREREIIVHASRRRADISSVHGAVDDPSEVARVAGDPQHAWLAVPVLLRRHVQQLRDAGVAEQPHRHKDPLAAVSVPGDHRDVPFRDLLVLDGAAAALLPPHHDWRDRASSLDQLERCKCDTVASCSLGLDRSSCCADERK